MCALLIVALGVEYVYVLVLCCVRSVVDVLLIAFVCVLCLYFVVFVCVQSMSALCLLPIIDLLLISC